MSIFWRDTAAVKRSAGAVSFRTADGVSAGDLKAIDQIRVRIADGTNPADLKEGYKQGIRLAALPDSASGYSSAKTGPITSGSVTVNVAGGTPPYTHSWAASGGVTATNPTSATTAFVGTPPAIEGEVEGEPTDTVTDANGLTNSISVPVFIQRGA